MTTYQQLEEQLASDLVDGYGSAVAADATRGAPGMLPDLVALIDALPYYGDAAFNTALRGALVNLLGVNLANPKLSPHPNEYGFGYSQVWWYDGPYSGYRDAFFTNMTASTAASEIARLTGLDGSFLAGYSLALLTSAAQTAASVPVDSSQLTAALSRSDSILRQRIGAMCQAVITLGFPPTAAAWAKLTGAGETATARDQLVAAVRSSTFITNSNIAMSAGGDSTNAAVWFLFNNWVLLAALGADVAAAITAAIAAGLVVPPEIGPTSWAVGYNTWFVALSGADVAPVTGGRLTESMPEKTIISTSTGPGWPVKTSDKNGYSLSLADWGPLAAYKPPPASCLGAGTGVLMADNSVRRIEDVQAGDEVWTVDGPHRVALVERPPQAGRTLMQVNGLDVFVTVGHPVRCHDSAGPRYAAVGAWVLRDTTPTMTEWGVVELTEGVVLRGVVDGELEPVEVTSLTEHPAAGGEPLVFDLLLEDWERRAPAYYVGGPDVFIAVEAESANPLRDPAASIALLTALEAAVPVSRANVLQPAEQLPSLVSMVDPHAYHRRMALEAWIPHEGQVEHPPIPGPDYYMQDGEWEPHASMLEVYLLRRFAQPWRRALATGWRDHPKAYEPNDYLTVLVHDLEIVGEADLQPDTPITVQVTLLAPGRDPGPTGEVSETPRAERRWHPMFDEVVELGTIRPDAATAVEVTAHHGGAGLGRVRIPVESLAASPATSHYLFGDDGAITARVSLDARWQSFHARRAEADRRERWSRRHARLAAKTIGTEIGRGLVTAIGDRPTSSRPR